jgi:hypothetical protein
MALNTQLRILGGHARAVVAYANQTQSAFFNLDADPTCAGVDRVLDQLFDYAGRTLDDFASGDLVG